MHSPSACQTLGRATQSTGLLVLLAMLLALPAPGDEAASQPKEGGVSALVKFLSRPYKHLFEGAARDGERYQGLAARAQQRVQEMRQRRVEERQVLPVLQLGWLCQRQADNHQQLLRALERLDQEAARRAMADILFLEAEARRLTAGDFGRDWLTFQEVEQFERLGQRPRRPEAGVLPFQRALWSPAGTEAGRPGGGR